MEQHSLFLTSFIYQKATKWVLRGVKMKGIQHSRKIAVAITLIALMLLLILPLNLVQKAKASETVVYSQGFESSDGGYTHTGTPDEWQWGTPTNPSGTTAHSGTKCWATDLTSNPPADTSCYLTSPAITLPSITATQRLRVNFWAWIDVYFMSPRGDFSVSSDGTSWVTIAELRDNERQLVKLRL